MSTKLLTKEEIMQQVTAYTGKKVKLAVTDIDGILRGKVMHLDKFLSIIDGGFGFCDVIFGWDANDNVYDNNSYTGLHTGYPDAPAHLVLDSFRRIPWDQDMPFFLADFTSPTGASLPVCPRSLLRKVTSKAEKMGLTPLFSQEFEWFNFRENAQELADREFRSPRPITSGMFGYSLIRAGNNRAFFNDLFDYLHSFDVPLEGLHTETGPGVYEGAILYDHILEAADRATLFKTAVKEIGALHGILPTFMAKWNAELPGSSGHIHQSLWNADRSKNLFFDAADPDQMSKVMRHYIAGIIHCMPHILPMVAPTVNSYKRFVEGMWAPTTPTWGKDNRTTACRVLGGSEKSTRVEYRVPGADTNPYLAMAASLASGLYGIENELPLTAKTIGDAYADKNNIGKMPTTLATATQAMQDSPLANQLFGEIFTRHFVETRQWEVRQYDAAITDFELKRYFEII